MDPGEDYTVDRWRAVGAAGGAVAALCTWLPDAKRPGAAAQIQQLSQAARCVQVPQGKDVNAFYLRAGRDAVRGWLLTTLTSPIADSI